MSTSHKVLQKCWLSPEKFLLFFTGRTDDVSLGLSRKDVCGLYLKKYLLICVCGVAKLNTCESVSDSKGKISYILDVCSTLK